MDKKTINLLGYNVFLGNKDFFQEGFQGVVNTINPHSLCIARKDNSFQKALKTSDIIIPDGVGIVLAARFLARKKLTKIAGADLHLVTIKALNERKGSCFYLGSSETTLELIRKKISNEFPNIRVGTYSPPYKNSFSDMENEVMIDAINNFKPDVLFVGMTAPKQEKWVHANHGKIRASAICSIGAVFDFYAGTVKRSGNFWISIGLEWLPRLIREPRRLWRRTVVSTPVFMWLVLLCKLRVKVE